MEANKSRAKKCARSEVRTRVPRYANDLADKANWEARILTTKLTALLFDYAVKVWAYIDKRSRLPFSKASLLTHFKDSALSRPRENFDAFVQNGRKDQRQQVTE